MENNRQRTVIVALVALAIVGIVGGTIAFFNSETVFRNQFKTPAHESEFTEQFSSPENWLPGDEEKKEVSVKNTGEYDIAVRISYTEEWIGGDGVTQLPLVQNQDGTEVRAAIINFPNKEDWGKRTESDGVTYYYYKDILGKDESTSLFMDKVTFNKDIKHDETCTNIYTYSDGTTSSGSAPEEGKTVKSTTQRCESTGQTYAGGTYILTIKIETIQWDQYKNGWGVDEDLKDLEWDKTLLGVIKKDALLDTDINFIKYSSDTNGKGVYIYNETKNDEYPIYYYRGEVYNNNIIFANFCWKIVRTTETGGTKLIYNGEIGVGSTCNNTGVASQIGKSKYNKLYNNSKYIGYVYDANTSSTIKDYIDDWYEEKILNQYDNYLEDTIWCDDKSNSKIIDQKTYYGFGIRFLQNEEKPLVSCPSVTDSYTIKTSSKPNSRKVLDYPIALLTGDEAQLAGFSWATKNLVNGTSTYNKTTYLYTGQQYWLMAPLYWDPAKTSNSSYLFYISDAGCFINVPVLGDAGVRPALSLKPGLKILSGNGTTEKPYIVG